MKDGCRKTANGAVGVGTSSFKISFALLNLGNKVSDCFCKGFVVPGKRDVRGGKRDDCGGGFLNFFC